MLHSVEKISLRLRLSSKMVVEARTKHVQSDTKKRELLKNPTKIEEIQEKKNY